MKKFLAVWVVAGLTGCAAVASQPSVVSQVRASMERNAVELLKNPAVSSVSIGVFKAGVAYTGHFGELDPGQGNRPSDETFYEIASVTKTFTGTLVAQAVLEGKLGLETDIRDFLDGDYPNLEFRGQPIRVRHLITHTSGLPANNKPVERVGKDNADGRAWREIYQAERGYSKAEFFKDLREVEITTEPGQEFLYSNVSANLTGYILEQAYGKSFEHLLQEKIFEKAQMVDTGLHLTSAQEARLAGGYNGEGVAMPRLPLADTLWGAEGALKSTLPDMLRYAEFHLDDSNPVIPEVRKKFKKLDDGYWVGYFWWAIDVEEGVISYRHDGGAMGTRGVFLLYPTYDLATYVVTNNASESIFPALSALSEALRDELGN